VLGCDDGTFFAAALEVRLPSAAGSLSRAPLRSSGEAKELFFFFFFFATLESSSALAVLDGAVDAVAVFFTCPFDVTTAVVSLLAVE
jgi:hypothetical protein